MDKYGTAGQATDGDIIWRRNMREYRYILGICNTYCVSIAAMVTRTPLTLTLHYIAGLVKVLFCVKTAVFMCVCVCVCVCVFVEEHGLARSQLCNYATDHSHLLTN